jgi:hypothetical protein
MTLQAKFSVPKITLFQGCFVVFGNKLNTFLSLHGYRAFMALVTSNPGFGMFIGKQIAAMPGLVI